MRAFDVSKAHEIRAEHFAKHREASQAELLEALEAAAGWLEDYRDQHFDKANAARSPAEKRSRMFKAGTNGERANKLRSVIAKAQGMVLREDSRSEAEGVAHHPGRPQADAPKEPLDG